MQKLKLFFFDGIQFRTSARKWCWSGITEGIFSSGVFQTCKLHYLRNWMAPRIQKQFQRNLCNASLKYVQFCTKTEVHFNSVDNLFTFCQTLFGSAVLQIPEVVESIRLCREDFLTQASNNLSANQADQLESSSADWRTDN